MSRKLTAWTYVIVMAGLLAGCATGQRFASTAEQINAAFPVAPEVLTSKDALLQMASEEQQQEIQAQYDVHLTQRAQGCAKDYVPESSTSAEEIRQQLEPSCFVEADQEIIVWLGNKKIGMILAQPPHTPIPAAFPKEISTQSEIQGTPQFAKNAGIAILTTTTTLSLIDLNTAKMLLQERPQDASGRLSPNGRLFITADKDSLLKIRDTLTGENLAKMPDVRPREFHWLDDRTAFYVNRTGQSYFIDFASGETLATGLNDPVTKTAVRMPGVPDQYAVLTDGKIRIFELLRTQPMQTELKLLSEKSTQMSGIASASTTADGKFVFAAKSHLSLLDLNTLESEMISLEPFTVQSGVATPDPDKILLTGFIQPQEGTLPQDYVYSISKRTLAQFIPETSDQQRRINLAPFNRMGMVDGYKIVPIEKLQATGVQTIADFVKYATVVSNQRKREIEERRLAAMRFCHPSGKMNPGGVELQAIGIYEGSPIEQGKKGKTPAVNTVKVKVAKTAKPIVLALFNHEPVLWDIQLDKGAALKEIILSAPEPTGISVMSKKSIKIYRPSFGAAHEDCEFFTNIARKVKAFNGLDVTTFQGEYRGSEFTVPAKEQGAKPVTVTVPPAQKPAAKDAHASVHFFVTPPETVDTPAASTAEIIAP